jgi:hypothetical protein
MREGEAREGCVCVCVRVCERKRDNVFVLLRPSLCVREKERGLCVSLSGYACVFLWKRERDEREGESVCVGVCAYISV